MEVGAQKPTPINVIGVKHFEYSHKIQSTPFIKYKVNMGDEITESVSDTKVSS